MPHYFQRETVSSGPGSQAADCTVCTDLPEGTQPRNGHCQDEARDGDGTIKDLRRLRSATVYPGFCASTRGCLYAYVTSSLERVIRARNSMELLILSVMTSTESSIMQVRDHVVAGIGEGQTWVVGSAVSNRMGYASLSCAR